MKKELIKDEIDLVLKNLDEEIFILDSDLERTLKNTDLDLSFKHQENKANINKIVLVKHGLNFIESSEEHFLKKDVPDFKDFIKVLLSNPYYYEEIILDFNIELSDSSKLEPIIILSVDEAEEVIKQLYYKNNDFNKPEHQIKAEHEYLKN